MSYLLDSNACIALIKGTPVEVRRKFEFARDKEAAVFVPAIALFELWYGVQKSSRPDDNEKSLLLFPQGAVSVLPFDEADAEAAGRIRANLEAAGKPIGAFDLLIAGQAVARELTLVTANGKEFRRVPGLRWEDWARP